MQIRVKGTKIFTDMHTGKMGIELYYPIKYNAYNVFKAAEEALNVRVVTLNRPKNSKDVIKHYCYWTIGNADSTVAIPALKKVQCELMILSRRTKLEVLNCDIINLEQLKQAYERQN